MAPTTNEPFVLQVTTSPIEPVEAAEESKESTAPTEKKMMVQVVGQAEKLKRKNMIVNTNHCRQELDTVQYVIKKFGYRETRESGDGNMLWYGLALRDADIDYLKNKMCMINRYPLMDVRTIPAHSCSTLRRRTSFV